MTGKMARPTDHFVYQRLHTLGGKAFHLEEHLRIAVRALERIYGAAPEFDRNAVASLIAGTLRANRVPAHTGATVLMRFSPHDDTPEVDFERVLLDAGYAHSPLRPKSVTYEYSIPFPAFPTNFQIEARALFDTLALAAHGATRSVRREGERLLSCGDAPLFAVRDRVVFTPPLTEGAMDSVERELVSAAAESVRLKVREEPILHSELKSFDELFFADAAGITSLAECDGAKFMSLAAPRLATALK